MRPLRPATLVGLLPFLALAACDAADRTTGPSGALLLPEAASLSLSGDGLDAFLDWAAFEAAAPELTVEGFGAALPAAGSPTTCEGPFEAATDNDCFGPGGIAEGLSIDAAEGDMIVLTAPFLEFATNVVGPWRWGVALEVAFPGEGTLAAGVHLLAPEGGPTDVGVSIYGSGGELLGSGDAPVGEWEGVFWGVTSEAPIGRIVFTPAQGVGLLLEEVAFAGGSDGGTGPDGDPGDEAEVRVEVRQGAINPTSRGVIPMVVYSGPGFDATAIDPATVRFGPGEAAPMDDRLRTDDVDGDGLPDLLLHFPIPEVALGCGDEEASLSGETLEGAAFEATAEVRVLCLPAAGRGAGPRGR